MDERKNLESSAQDRAAATEAHHDTAASTSDAAAHTAPAGSAASKSKAVDLDAAAVDDVEIEPAHRDDDSRLPPHDGSRLPPLGADRALSTSLHIARDEVKSEPRRFRFPSYLPLAAGIALAAVAGMLAGAAATTGLMHNASAPAAAAAAQNRALQTTVAQLESELASLKGSIGNAQRSASAQFKKLAERLDHAEKAQAEPSAKLAKLQESIDRIDRRQAQAATQAAAAQAAAGDITGSIGARKNDAKTNDAKNNDTKTRTAEGWHLRDFYAGRAVVEGRDGTLFEIGPGSNVPGLGKIETIRRENGRVVVRTQAGSIISAALDPPRTPYAMPYRY
jgi:hypothetical protein